eukprot:CAMPEP_0178987286 /NCGR_PEP_ID=MMETSP0795-20121207/3179_1 /TAXON_ID=88552 /ORGANISM="Amoebophrya sp., Strain Ameob2" /LENGTH=141 /DNA_ID=CAMNT_0020678449 /DNA_START=917 /DNA_END=1342 /DNA_ORIENTATION=-
MNNRNKANAHEILEKLETSGNEAPNWLKGMAIATGNFGVSCTGTGGKEAGQYGGQDFRKHTTGGFRTAAERDEAKKFKTFDQDAYGEGDAAQAQIATRLIAPEPVTFEHMAKSGKGGGGKGGGKGKGDRGGGKINNNRGNW